MIFLLFSVAAAPSLLSLVQLSPTSVRVEWIHPSGGATVTGYVVHYSDSTSENSKHVAASSSSSDISNLNYGPSYNVWVESTSGHLSGVSNYMNITLSENVLIIIILC